MTLKPPSFKTLALTISGLVATCLLLSYLVLPGILQTQAEKYIAEKAGHHLTMDKPEFNPFKLSLRLSNVRLTEPDGKPLLAFRELFVDLSASSLFHRALIFDDIRLDGLETSAVLLPDGKLNWSALIDAFKEKQQTSNSSLPRFDIHHLTLSHTRLDFADKRIKPTFITRIEPANLELTDISSLPNDRGQYKFFAHTSFGAELAWHGEASLEPLAVQGNFSIEHANLATFATYLKDMPLVLTRGTSSLSANYSLGYAHGKLEVNLEHLKAKLTGLELEQRAGPAISISTIEANEGRYDLTKNIFSLNSLNVADSHLNLPQRKDASERALELGSFSVKKIRIDLATQQVSIGDLALKDGRIRITRDAMGGIDIVNAWHFPETKKQETAKSNWHYRVEKLELADFAADFKDETVKPAAQLSVENIALGADGISDNWNNPVPVRASFKAKDGGSFEAEGKVVPALPSADFKLNLEQLNVTPAQPYLFAVAKLKLTNGQLSTAGNVTYDTHGLGYQGSFALNDLNLKEADTGNLFMSWKSLSSRSFKLTSTSLDIGELLLNGLDTKLIINKDKSVSFKRILRPSTTRAAPTAKITEKTKPFVVNIDRMRFNRGEMDYADYSLTMPFGTRIHRLKGVITNLSSQPGTIAELKLDGRVDDYGSALATGQLDLFNPTDSLDLKVIFRNIEMARLTPYSATFAGRKITSGKLDLDLEYQIHQRQLQGKNQIIMKQLTLGERVASPEAKNLPLDLAISILQDSDGRIDLDLPMSGSLDDPKFSYGSIIWKAIENVIAKIVTAPFRALGALFGGEEKFENIVFEAGHAQLAPPEQEKLAHLAAALVKRPSLSLTIQGVYADSDKVALQDRILRRMVDEKSGQHLGKDDDPGPLALQQPKIQSALENIFSNKFGNAELAAYKSAFNQVNPGKLNENAASKLMARFTGLFQEKRALSTQQISQMKDADFYTVLFNRLRNEVTVDKDSLLALATARGVAIDTALKASGVPAERLSMLAAEKTDATGQDVPIKLVLSPGIKTR